MNKLTIIQGPTEDKGREFTLPMDGEFILGRGLNTHTILHDKQVSGIHCKIQVKGGHAYLTDNKSSNGTFVAGRDNKVTQIPPHQPYALTDGCRIRLGKTLVLEYKAFAIEAPVTAEPDSNEVHLGGTIVGHLPNPGIECQKCRTRLFPRLQYSGFQVRCPHCRHMVMLPGRAAVAQPVY